MATLSALAISAFISVARICVAEWPNERPLGVKKIKFQGSKLQLNFVGCSATDLSGTSR